MGKFAKKKILIPLTTDNCVRTFFDAGAFSNLEKEFELHFAVPMFVKKEIKAPHVHRLGDCEVTPRSKRRWLSFYISMKRHQDRCTTFPVKYRETFYNLLPWTHQMAMDVLTLPGIADVFMASNEAVLGRAVEIDRLVAQVRPDLLVVPCAFNETFSVDMLKSAKAKGIKSLLLMFNWDNVSSKGVLPLLPDYMTVWGRQTLDHAVDIQKMPKERVKILGAPQFEHYRKAGTISPQEMRRKNNVPLDKKVILFTGMSRLVDEIGLLQRLEDAMERGELPGVHVHYRPHPWKVVYPKEKNFFDCGFKHITMDIQLKDHYVSMLTDESYRKANQSSFVPDYAYYPALFNAVDAVISPGTTMGIEAMVMGKPVLVKGFGDGDKNLDADRMIYTYAHHDCWPKMPASILCRERDEFINDCRRLLALTHEPGIAQQLREQVQYVVYQDQQTYAQRLLNYVKEIL